MKKRSVTRNRRQTRKRGASAGRPVSPFSLHRILVPIDFSAHSKDALRYAVPLARRFGASIHLVYVVEPTVYPADLGFGQVVYPTFEEELIEKGKEELQGLLRSEIGKSPGSTAVVRTGKPHQEILLEAEDRNADLIVMATHGHTGVEHMLFGSTAERIVRNATCPVLTIRPSE
jgi:nucleotide-binding universal stress UspA family protein